MTLPSATELPYLLSRPGGRARRTAVAAAVATVFGVLLAPEALSQAATQEDIQRLQKQVEKLQEELEKMKAQQAAAAQAAAPGAQAVAGAQAAPGSQAASGTQAVPGAQGAPGTQSVAGAQAAPGAQAGSGAQAAAGPQTVAGAHVTPAPSDAAKTAPVFYAGPVKVTLGGFVELMAIERNRNESADWASNFNGSIPYPNSHQYYISEFHLTERQSRISVLAEGPDGGRFHPEAYIETDFGAAGGTANYNEGNSFSPRVRHFYADLTDKETGMFLMFGQAWSMVTAQKVGLEVRNENIVQTIDGQYVPGFSWLRVPQIRFVEKFNEKLSVGVSLENPAQEVTNNTYGTNPPALTTIFNNPGATNSFTAPNNAASNNVTTDYLPDVILKAALDPGWGHYEVFVLNRWFRSRDIATGDQHNVKSTGQGYGANLILPLVPKMLDFQAGILAGKGIGRYGSAQLPDVTSNPNTLGLTPLRGLQALLGLTFRPTPTLTTFVYAGKEMVDSQYWNYPGGGKPFGYGYGDPLAVNTGCETEGVGTCAANTSQIISGTIGGWWKFYSGPLGNAQFGLTDTYVKREIFSGVGGDPNTNINIALASFRYYPFQK